MNQAFGAEEGDLLLFVADKPKVVNDSLGRLRNHLAKLLGLTDKDTFRFVWITGFPLLEWDDVITSYSIHYTKLYDLAHLYSISGLHFGLLALMLYTIARWLYARSERLLLLAPPRRILPPLLLVPRNNFV